MRIRQLVQDRVSAGASGESLRPLSAQEIGQVAGAQNYDYVDPLPPTPVPPSPPAGPGGISPRFVEV